MAALADFVDLQTAVVEHVGTPKVADVMPRLVQLAEVNINRRLRCHDMVTTATLTLSAGQATLPTDMISILGVYDASGFEYVQQPLQAVKPMDTRHFYAVKGNTLVSQIGAATLTLEYYAKVPTISGGGTNWALAKFPGLYLYAVGLEAAKYLKDLELVKVTAEFAAMEYAAAAETDYDARYSRAVVRVAGNTP
jgi:hypothetical protein